MPIRHRAQRASSRSVAGHPRGASSDYRIDGMARSGPPGEESARTRPQVAAIALRYGAGSDTMPGRQSPGCGRANCNWPEADLEIGDAYPDDDIRAALPCDGAD